MANVVLLKWINNAVRTFRLSLQSVISLHGPQLAHKASYEAKVAAEAIQDKNLKLIIWQFQQFVSQDPELATVGLNEQQAKDEGYEVSAGKFPLCC